MPSKRKGVFRSMSYRDRVALVLAALLFAAGQIIGALLNRFDYDWLAWMSDGFPYSALSKFGYCIKSTGKSAPVKTLSKPKRLP
jgi:hypothetical protein